MAESVWSCDASVRPGENGTCTSSTSVFGRLLDGGTAGEDDEVGEGDLLPAVWAPLNSAWIPSRACSTVANSAGLLTSQSFCGESRMRAPLAPPRLSLSRNVDAEAHAVVTSWETDRPDARILLFRAATSCSSTSG